MTFEQSLAYTFVTLLVLTYNIALSLFLAVKLKEPLFVVLTLYKFVTCLSSVAFGVDFFIVKDIDIVCNLVMMYKSLKVQTLLCDVEDSREKLDRFFSYNFLFFDDD